MPFKLDTENEALKALLATDDGKAALEALIGSNVDPLKSNRSQVMTERDEVRNELKAYQALGDITALQGLKNTTDQANADLAAAGLKKAEAEGDVTRLKAHYEGEIKSRDDNIANLKNHWVGAEKSRLINSAVEKSGGVSDLIAPMLVNRVSATLEESNGEYNVKTEIQDASGFAMMVGDGAERRAATIDDVLTTMKSDAAYAGVFRASGASGSGASQQQGAVNNGGDVFNVSSKEFSLTDANKAALENPESYNGLQGVAQKK